MFAVRWLNEARDTVNEMWENSDKNDRERISDADDILIHKLRDYPEDQGESREDDFRIMHQSPLGVRFHIDKESRIVHVTQVWRYC